MAKRDRATEPSVPPTRKIAGDMPGGFTPSPDSVTGGVVRTMGDTEHSSLKLVSTMDRALGDTGRVNPYDPGAKPVEHKIYRRG